MIDIIYESAIHIAWYYTYYTLQIKICADYRHILPKAKVGLSGT